MNKSTIILPLLVLLNIAYILIHAPTPLAVDSKQPSIMDALTKPKASKTAAKKLPSFESSEDEAPPKAVAAKAKGPAKRKQNPYDSDSGSASDNLMDRIRAKATSNASKVSSYLGTPSTLSPLCCFN